jgi:HEAT repeat protein
MTSRATDSSGEASAFQSAQARRTEVTLASYAGKEAPARSALADADASVRAAALSALDRLGTLTSSDVATALADPEIRVRRRACELANLLPIADPSLGEPLDEIDTLLLSFLRTGDEIMAELAAWSLGERHQQQNLDPSNDNENTDAEAEDGADTEHEAVETNEANEPSTGELIESAQTVEIVQALSETVYQHPDALVREAAVAALGCIGTPEAKAPVLHAIGDKATVRRRAIIALAAFEGEDVEAALALATGDRDWQVRQAAEDLLN